MPTSIPIFRAFFNMDPLWIGFVFVGVIAGFSAGLLGISGGVVTVPLLVFLFSFLGFAKEHLIYFAIGTSFAATVFSALSATVAYQKRKEVLWELFFLFLPGVVVGALVGAMISQWITAPILSKMFGALECLVGSYLLFAFKREKEITIPSKTILRLLSFAVGTLSNILGIGGGTLVAPLLMAFHLPPQKAIGTASATGMAISFLGAVCYLIYGVGQTRYPFAIGYLYLPAFIIVSIATMCAAPWGAKLAHRISLVKLRKIFAATLICIGILMIVE